MALAIPAKLGSVGIFSRIGNADSLSWVGAPGNLLLLLEGPLSFFGEPLSSARSWSFQSMYLRVSDKTDFRYRSSTGNRSHDRT
jgi:hypothetical protein